MIKGVKGREIYLRWMSICHTFDEARYLYCQVGLIGKVITYDLRDRNNYLRGIVIITTYICLRCLVKIYPEVRDYSL